jgi:proline dehydrogenase
MARRRGLRAFLDLAGRAYVPGEGLDDALALARAHAAAGRACTLGYFDGHDDSPAEVAARNCAAADAMSALSPTDYVSIKAPGLRYDLDALDRVLAHCGERQVRVHFDSHDLGNAELTLACAERAVEQGLQVGLTLPGRWRRSLDDAAHACTLGLRVRVVKGEWPDPEVPDADARAGFLAVVDTLIAHRAAEVAVASHDPPLAREALRRLQAAGIRCELELLNGLPQRAALAVAQTLGVPVRVYIPFGVAWRPYALRKALRRPRILLWLAKDLVLGLRQRWRSPSS